MLIRTLAVADGYWHFATISRNDMVGNIFNDRLPINVSDGNGNMYIYFLKYSYSELVLKCIFSNRNISNLYYKNNKDEGTLNLYLYIRQNIEYTIKMDDPVYNGNIIETFSGGIPIENVDELVVAEDSYCTERDNELKKAIGSDVITVLASKYNSPTAYMGKAPDINNLSCGLHYYDGWDITPTSGTAPFIGSMGIWLRFGVTETVTVDIVFKMNDAHIYISRDMGNTWINS